MGDKFDSIGIPIDVSEARQRLKLYFLLDYIIPLTIVGFAIQSNGLDDYWWVVPLLMFLTLWPLAAYYVFRHALEKGDTKEWEYLFAGLFLYPAYAFQWPAYYLAKKQYSSTYETYFANLNKAQKTIGKYVSRDVFIRICRDLNKSDPIYGIFETSAKKRQTVILRRLGMTIDLTKEINLKYEEIEEFYIQSDVLIIESGLRRYILRLDKSQMQSITEILAANVTSSSVTERSVDVSTETYVGARISKKHQDEFIETYLDKGESVVFMVMGTRRSDFSGYLTPQKSKGIAGDVRLVGTDKRLVFWSKAGLLSKGGTETVYYNDIKSVDSHVGKLLGEIVISLSYGQERLKNMQKKDVPVVETIIRKKIEASKGSINQYETSKLHTQQLEEDPIKILNTRLAKGEITKEEYNELKKIVS